MKKLICILVAIAILLLAGCSKNARHITDETGKYTDENGNSVLNDGVHRTVGLKTFPCWLAYNGKEVQLSNVEFYQEKSGNDYSLYIVIRMDTSDLDEKEVKQLRESDLSSFVSLENNRLSDDSFFPKELGSAIISDSSEYIIVYQVSSPQSGYAGFEQSDVSVSITIDQKEVYASTESNGNETEHRKTEMAIYKTELTDSITSFEEIQYPLRGYIEDWMNGIA